MLKYVREFLPERISKLIYNIPNLVQEQICEIRLRKNSPISLSTYTKNLFITSQGSVTKDIRVGVVCTENEIDFAINRLCEGSVYRYMPTINSGYIVTQTGIRAGICGECIYEKDRVTAITNFTSVNIRIPHDFEDCGDVISRYLIKEPNKSLLLISPPGWGKTTVIRSVARALSAGKLGAPKRVSVIDERGEILPKNQFGLIDRFYLYSKKDGIEIAVRLFSPELIVCDEIGQSDDIDALLSLQNTGVPLLATTHGNSLDSCFKRPNIKRLIDNSVFQAFAVIEKIEDGNKIVLTEGNFE